MPTKPDTTNSNKKAMIEALKRSMGIVTTACDNVGINRCTHYEWLANDTEYKAEVESVNERTGDFVEGALLKKIKDGDTPSTIFYCKTRLKSRGYVERTEQTGPDGGAIQVQVIKPDLDA